MENQKIDLPSFITGLVERLQPLTRGEFKVRFDRRGDEPILIAAAGIRAALAGTLLLTDLPYRLAADMARGCPPTPDGIAVALKEAVERIAYGDAGGDPVEWERNKLLHGTAMHLGDTYVRQLTQALANEHGNTPEWRTKPDHEGLPRGYVLPCEAGSDGVAVIGLSLQLADHFNDPEKAMALVFRFRDVPTQELGPVMVTFLTLAALRNDLNLEDFADLCSLAKDLHARH